ncbi:SPOR domain-containing protein [Thiothrix subterranea]|uniref:SPOR domain-containing protein n=2 Tax=Thiothrix subterranea TaxID=2735563 RepID=A0AA51MN86_9GAMM|nr:SPOR domain-containing protein [Thiothrix subterranea]MDQ5770517.1 SPOR domain-containing protein [Thiothrix subterranea]WML87477.1 SPOR domain-containing protein [Thiothrix subterranea]
MTKDFKKQAASGSAFGQYGLGWMVGGVAIGLIIGAGMYALANKGNAPDTNATNPPGISNTTSLGDSATSPDSTLIASNTPNAADNLPEPAPDEAPGFSYHAVLPQLEIDVPLAVQVEQAAVPPKPAADKKPALADTQTAAPPKPETKKPTPAAISGSNAFQIGSYKTQDQAADMQSRLKKKGLSSRIETANIQGATWFRVRVGPATSPEMLQQWQQTLSGMGISPMAIRM